MRFAADYAIDCWSAQALAEVGTTGRCDPPRDATRLALASVALGG